ncbi:MAG: FtsW/RodA/SpoVE family cell cycle protein [Lachnospiraceae bacterium]|nr:FtsW/RodA/SpoVE family cell cycle protein [Lachnospiraceae bacterium]
MASFISETSNYLFVWIILAYVISNIIVFFFKNPEDHKHFYAFQFIIAILFHAVGYITLFMRSEDIKYFFFFAFQEIIIVAIMAIYLTLYPSISRLLLNNMIFFLDISFVILGRLAFKNALRQFIFTIVLLIVSLFIPFVYQKIKFWRTIPYAYCALGIISLASVWLTGTVTHGSKLILTLKLYGYNFRFQPSEFVKLSMVFFMAALFSQKKNKLRFLLGGLFMLVHVMLLVLEKDLGSAGIYLITFFFMVFCATASPFILPVGAAVGAGGFAFAYKEFAHVRIRVKTWLNPFEDVENTGWQLSQSLFAIGTGGWFGMGLFQGYPKSIPYVEEDFIFSAIGEEMGVLFSVLLIALYLFTALHIIRYSYRVKSTFHQYLLFGFAICFAVQVFITIGGGTRLIPLTGVTLPLISMGGSSLSTTILMFSVIQAIYVKEFNYKNLSKEIVHRIEDREDEEWSFEEDDDDEYEDEDYEAGEYEEDEYEEDGYEESEENAGKESVVEGNEDEENKDENDEDDEDESAEDIYKKYGVITGNTDPGEAKPVWKMRSTGRIGKPEFVDDELLSSPTVDLSVVNEEVKKREMIEDFNFEEI